MNKETGTPETVVILGASFAGLFAAAACAGAGRRVIVVERDRLPLQPAPRSGVPQGNQPHVFLHRGMLALEELLPGAGAELESLGAVVIDTGDLAWLAEAGWSDYGVKAYTVLSVTRPLLEEVVRRRVRALPGIEIHDGTRVVGIRRHGQAPTWEVSLADGNVMDADLVIDACGRSSRLPVWLKSEGLGDVPISEVDARVGYATRTYSLPTEVVEAAGVVVLMTPQTLAGGMALPVEGGRWLVTAVGAGERRPPRDEAGFEQFLAGLADPAVEEVAAAGEPHGDVQVHRQTGNQRHHYERLRRWPPGLLVVGDALCAFNPVYGQGITVAACQAVVLRDSMRNDARPVALRRLQRRFARVAALPWAIATGQDLRLLSSEGRRSAAQVLFGAWADEVGRLAAHGDTRATLAMARVYHLMASPMVMAHPGLVLASIRTRWRSARPLNPRPPIRREPA